MLLQAVTLKKTLRSRYFSVTILQEWFEKVCNFYYFSSLNIYFPSKTEADQIHNILNSSALPLLLAKEFKFLFQRNFLFFRASLTQKKHP